VVASALRKAKSSLPQKIDAIINQQTALGKEKDQFMEQLPEIKKQIETCNTSNSSSKDVKTLIEAIEGALKTPQLTNHQKMLLQSIKHLYDPPKAKSSFSLRSWLLQSIKRLNELLKAKSSFSLRSSQVAPEGVGDFDAKLTIETLDLAFSALANCTPCYQCKSGQDRTKTMSILHEMANDDTYLKMLANGFTDDAEKKQFGLKFFELATQNLGIAEQARPRKTKELVQWRLNKILLKAEFPTPHPIPKLMQKWACLTTKNNDKINALLAELSKKTTDLMKLSATGLIKALKKQKTS
jgi:hypothetical protein